MCRGNCYMIVDMILMLPLRQVPRWLLRPRWRLQCSEDDAGCLLNDFKRVKKLDKIDRFRVDGCELQTGADGQPLSPVCMIFVRTISESELEVELSRNVPMGPSVIK